ncbi:hypothetical protein [Chryseobacterium indoltheticum]|uniref:Uncharacterized protein n=1 Tax=Chryseobacterium indoltheticum TaxID=254 RepID=A0A381FN79_9FLAO|nr:hypothetical protein [Chryseobacterium indoltheticum]SUX47957.1 Uncharacterised protein [Chryseobacterium indoltheticum]
MKKTIRWRCLFCQIFLVSFLSSGIVSAQTGPNDDFDGDGIINSIDIDDDNDGVPDATESPNCYYTASEIAIPASVTTTVAHSGTIANLYDNNPATLFNFTNGTTKVNLTVFEVTPIRPVVAAGLQIEMNNYGQTEFSDTAASLTMEGWNGTAWVTLMPAFNPSTAPNTAQGLYQTFNFTQNQNTAYSKFRLQGLAGTIVGSQIREVKLLMPNNYIASRYPKASCADANIDGDNILPHFDLDSDGDGYSDALEAGATTNTTSNYQFPDVDANNDGLVDAVDADNNGYVNYNSTYFEYALNKNISATADSDGDGIVDTADLDDDNDGIPDTVECGFGIQTIAGGVKNLTETLPAGLNASNALYSQYGLIIRERSKAAPYNIVRDNFNIVSHSGDADNEYIYFGVAISYSFEYYNPFTNQKRLVDRIQVSAEPGTDGSTLTLVCFDNAGTVIYTGTFPDGSTMSIDTTQTLNNSKIHRFIVSGSNNTTGFDQVFVQGMSVFAGSCDTDGDTVPNHLDLDSDGDGCSDLAESGVLPNPPGDISTPSSTTNNNGMSYGIAANKLTGSQLKPSGIDLNNNGLNDSVESTTTPGTVNYPSTYNPYAIGSNYAACADTDGDTILDINDIDDDNDGVLDAVESPSCFSTAAEIAVPQSVTTQVANTSTIANVYDNNIATTFAFTNNSTKVNLTVFEIRPSTPLKASALYIRYNAATANALGTTASSVSVDGWNGTIWIPLQTYTPANSSANIQSFAIPSGSQAIYKKYRLQGILGTVSNVDITEVGLTAASDYIPSAHPKPTCTNDTDGDGVPNHRDLDSDGDGCSDSVEAGNTVFTANNTTTYNTGTDANNNGLLDQFESSTTPGTINYISTYTNFATDANVSACLDSDGDGIPDITDIDDDNDGVLDVVEGCTGNQSVYVYAYPSLSQTGSETQPLYTLGTSTTTPNRDEVDAYFYGVGEGVKRPSNTSLTLIEGTYGANGSINSVNNFQNGEIDFQNSSEASVANTGGYYIIEFLLQIPLSANTVSLRTTTNFACRHALYVAHDGSASPVPSIYKDDVRAVGSGNGSTFSPEITFTNANGRYVRIALTTNDGNANSAVTLQWSINGNTFTGVPFSAVTSVPCTDIDTDNDGIPNRLDLDSDGDGCPDAVEAGTATQAGAGNTSTGTLVNTGGTQTGVANAIVGNNTPAAYGTNGFYSGIETNDTSSATYTGIYSYNQYAIVSTLNLCTDTDGDGIIDLNDIDDDNDGIVDAVESPACFYTAAEANTITSVTSPLNAAAGDPTANTEIATLHNGNTSDANPYNFVSQSVASGATIFTVTCPTPVTLSSITVTQIASGISSNGSAFGKLYGSVDGVSYILLTSGNGIALNTTSVTFANALPTPYRYYQIRSVGTVATGDAIAFNTGTAGIQEISSVIAVTPVYLASAHPKPGICSVDTDGDGVPNHLDLNSDGDGCSDLVESGVSPATDISTPASVTNNNGLSYGIAAFKLAGSQLNPMATDANNDGLNDSVDPDQNGITNYTSTYANAINLAIANCFCYVPAATSGIVLDTPQGITSLGRAGVNADNWPMVRKGAWTALEAKTKGFVPNRLTIGQINLIPAGDLREGMMVYNISSDCLYINTDGTPTGWKCFNTQACP